MNNNFFKYIDEWEKKGIQHPLLKKAGYYVNTSTNNNSDVFRTINNYQQRIHATGEEVPLWKKALNPVLKGLELIDRPRNALWNAIEDKAKGENGFWQGFKEGLTGEEYYEGTDLMKDLFGEADTKIGKALQWLGGFATEVLADPIDWVTLGAGSAAKGFLTGAGKSLTEESAEKLAKAGLRKINRKSLEKQVAKRLAEQGKKVTKSQFDDLVNNLSKEYYKDAFKRVGLSADEVEDIFKRVDVSKFYDKAGTLQKTLKTLNDTDYIERLHQAGNAGLGKFDDYVDTARVFNEAQHAPIEELEKRFKNIMESLIKKDNTNYAEFFDMWDRAGFNMGDLQKLGKTLKIDSQDYAKIFEKAGLRNIDELQDQYIKQMNKFYDNIVYDKAGYYKAIKDLANEKYKKALLKADKNLNALGKGLSAFGVTLKKGGKPLTNAVLQDIGAKASKKIIDKGGIAGKTLKAVQDTIGKMFDTKFVLGLNQSERDVLKYLRKTTYGKKNVSDEYLKKLSKEYDKTLKRFDKVDPTYRRKIVDYLEGTFDGIDELPKEIQDIALEMQDIYKVMADVEFNAGLLNRSKPANYFPHVENWDNYKTINKEMKLGGVTEKLRLNNLSARTREMGDTLDVANKRMLFKTASREGQEAFLEKIGVKSFSKLKDADISEIPQTAWDVLKNAGGTSNFFEDDPVKALISRGLRHNKIIADKEFLDDVVEVFGEKVNRHNVKEYIERGYDIVIPKSYFRALKLKGYGAIREISNDVLESLPSEVNHVIKKLLEEDFNVFSTISSDDYLLLAKHMPLDAYALPAGVKNTINNAGKRQILQGFDVITTVIDRFHGLWRPTVTGLRPDFHVRNLAGSTYQNIMDIGFKTLDSKINSIARKIAKGTDEVVELGGHKISTRRLRDAMIRTHAMSTIHRVDPRNMQKALDEELMSYSVKRPLSSLNKASKKAGNFVEDRVRAVNFVANVETALEQGVPIKQAFDFAGEQVAKFHFDYTDLTDVEKKLFRRIAPFYTWVRKNLPLQLELFLNDPAKYTRILKLQDNMTDAMGIDDKYAPEWFSSSVPLPLGYNEETGQATYANLSLPIAELMMLGDPKDYMNMLSPLFKVPYEFASNRKMITGAPIWRYPEEKNMQKLKHALEQFGVFRDVANTVSPKDYKGRAISPKYQFPMGVGGSLIKNYSVADAEEDSLYAYSRELANKVQYLKDKGINVPDMRTLKKLQALSPMELELLLQSGVFSQAK